MTFENFLEDCGVADPSALIEFLNQFSENFDPKKLSPKERDALDRAMSQVLVKITK